MKRDKIAIIGVLVLILLWIAVWLRGFWFGEVFTTHADNAVNRDAMREIHAQLELGDSYQDVLDAFWGQGESELRIATRHPEQWRISMPRELGASDWEMNISFGSGKVSAIEVRTAEGRFPEDGPIAKK